MVLLFGLDFFWAFSFVLRTGRGWRGILGFFWYFDSLDKKEYIMWLVFNREWYINDFFERGQIRDKRADRSLGYRSWGCWWYRRIRFKSWRKFMENFIDFIKKMKSYKKLSCSVLSCSDSRLIASRPSAKRPVGPFISNLTPFKEIIYISFPNEN